MKTLVMDDDSLCRGLLLSFFEEHGAAFGAADGRECLEAFQDALDGDEPYDLICLDIMMPGLDGQKILKIIRQVEVNRGISHAKRAKVFMITGLSDSGNIVKAFTQGGCHAYLTKPVNLDTLARHIGELRVGKDLEN